MPGFTYIGETLRRLRKELGKTLEEVGVEAKLGRGQLSRIENSRQEATFSTLAKILASQGISRKEFFRRYDLVEAEAFALRKGRDAGEPQGSGEPGATSGRSSELQDLVRRLGGWVRALSEDSPATAQGAVELGEFVFTFKLMPKTQPSAPLPAAPEELAELAEPPLSKRSSSRDSRKARTSRSRQS